MSRQLLTLRVNDGILFELQKDWNKAIETYNAVIPDVNILLDGINKEMDKLSIDQNLEEQEQNVKNLSLPQRRKMALALRHRVLFCLASVYLETKNKAESDSLFEQAEVIRKDLMNPVEAKVKESLLELNRFQHEHFGHDRWNMKIKIPKSEGGLISHSLFRKIISLIEFANEQVEELSVYNAKIQYTINSDLHKNYSKDAEIQAYGHLMQDYFRDAIYLRRQLFTGVVIFGKNESIQKIKESVKSRADFLNESNEPDAKDPELVDLNVTNYLS